MFLSFRSRLAATLIASLFLASAGREVSFAAEAELEIDPTADGRLRAMSEYISELERFSVDVVYKIEVESEEGKKQSRTDERHVIIEQPNRLAVTSTGKGENEGTVISDGKQLFGYWPAAERYLLGDAPPTFIDLLKEEAAALLGSGRTAVQYATGDWYRQAVASTSKIALLEPEDVDGVACDRIELTRQDAKIILWIEQGERPLLRKMQMGREVEASNADRKTPTLTMSYVNWELETEISDETFAINLPEDAEQVETLREEQADAEGPHPLLGAKAPECEFTLVDGGKLKLADLQGKKVVVIDFWALWCVPCVAALPTVDRVAAKYADRDVAFYAVNLGDGKKEIREFVEKNELKLPIVFDPDSALGKLFQASGIPMTVIVDKQGVVQVVNIGYGSGLEEDLAEEIDAVLSGKKLAEEALREAREAQLGGKPIPAGPKVFTSKDAIEDEIAFNLRTSVEPYKKVGSRDDAWDDAAIEFLTEASRHFSSAEGCKSRVELVDMAEPLAARGCDDPLVMYVHGAMLQDGAADESAQTRGLELVEQAYHGLVERGYPANRCFAAANRIYRTIKDDASQAAKGEEYLALTEQHALETILQDDLKTNDGRTLYNHVYGFTETLPLERMEKFCEAAKAHEDASPYVVNMLVGEYHLSAAWKARGGGYAQDVSEEGWKGYSEHMNLSRDAFSKAWKAAPKRPEAPTAMVRIAMGDSPSPEREMRKWFDRAVEAQFNYLKAYTNLLYGLMPRWHGSHEQMYQFGVECLETNRFDTNVPYEFCDAVWRIMRDDHNPLGTRYALRAGLYENVCKVCQGYIEQKDNQDVAWWKTVWLGFAYLTRQWDDATRLLKELDSELDADALSRFPLAANDVLSVVQVHASPHAETILAAFRTADRGERAEAIDALKSVLAIEGLEPSIAAQVSSRLQGLDWTADFQQGEPLSLMPGENLYGWKAIAGQWSQTPAGEITGVSDQSGVMLECQAKFGTHWQLTGEVTYGESPYNPWDAGILLNIDGSPVFSIMFNPTEAWVAAGPHRRLDDLHKPFTAEGRTTKFVMRVDGDTVNVWLDDVQVIEDQEVGGLSAMPASRLAIGAKYTWAGSNLTFRNLEIEKVEAEE